MNRTVFYLLLLLTTCLIRFTIIFEIVILSIFIIIFLSSTILDHREDTDPVVHKEQGENLQMDELDFGPKKEEHESNEEYFINKKMNDKIAKLGKKKNSLNNLE